MTDQPNRESLDLRKSSYSNANGGCVAAATDGDRCYVADTKDPDGPMLAVDTGAWRSFLAGLKRGHL